MINNFIHQKLKIVKLDEDLKRTLETYTVMFNPAEYEETFGVEISSETLVDNSEHLNFTQLKDQTLSLELTFDSSYVNEYAWMRIFKSLDSLGDQIQKLRDITGFPEQSSGADPNKIELVWGNMKYKCYLQKMTLNYTRFDRTGFPTRAKAKAIFRAITESSSSSKLTESAGNSSSGKTPSGQDITIISI